MEKNRGLSPVIATVLLVSIVVVLALVVFLYFRGTVDQAVVKIGKNINIVCQEDIKFSASYSGTPKTLQIINNGDVAIYDFKVRIITGGDYNSVSLKEISDFNSEGLNQGGTWNSQTSISNFDGADELLLIPVLIGTTSDGQVIYECDSSTGVEVTL